jgi:5-formyltetrahydrofolate cyclo-ligase
LKDKEALRQQLRAKRRSISPDKIFRKSRHIQALLFSIRAYQEAECVGFYVSSGHEVETHEMIRDCFQMGKQVVVPKCGDTAAAMSLCRIDSFNDLLPGAFGILEPCDPVDKVELDVIDVLIVPGLGFDRSGHRLGQGGGYYDALLASRPRAVVVGIAFAVQIVDTIPVEVHDAMVDLIVTENEVIHCKEDI